MITTAPEAGAVGTGAGTLLERDREITAAQAAFRRARLGQGSGLLIDGPPGIGKSRLIAEVAALAGASGMTVLRARGGTLERDYPFGIVRQLLDGVAADPEWGPRAFSGAGRAAGPAFLAEPEPTPPRDGGFAVLNGLFWAVANLAAETPVLVCVDDAQWADGPSLRWIEFLSRRLEELPVVLVVARHSGTEDGLDAVFGELQASHVLSTLEPAPLSPDGVDDLIRLTFDADAAPGFAQACHRRTGGIPFFVVELLRECATVGLAPDAVEAAARVAAMAPRTISTVVKARLTRLGATGERLAQALAVLGDGAELADASALAGLPVSVAAEVIGTLTRAGFLLEGDRLAFTHPLIAEAVRSEVPAVSAQRHADAARLLAERGRDPETVAAQVMSSPRAADDWAVERLREAARVAVARAAPDVAVRLLRRALAEPPSAPVRASVLVELGTAHATLHTGEAIQPLTEARDALPAGTERASVGLLLARLLAVAGRPAEAYAAIADARALLGPEDRELALALDAVELNAASIDPGAGGSGRSGAPAVPDFAGSTPGERAVLAGVALQLVQGLEPASDVQDLVRRALGDGQWWFAETRDPFTPAILAAVLHYSGHLQRSAELSTALAGQAGVLGSAALFADASAVRAQSRWRSGSLTDAEVDARRALAATGPASGQTQALATQALIGVLTDRGQLEQARAEADARLVTPTSPDSVLRAGVGCARAWLDLALGDFPSALARATAAGAALDAVGWVNPAGGEWRHISALAHLGLGRRAEAAAALAPALTASRRSGGAYELGLSLRVAALLHQPVSLELLAEARDVVAGSEFRLLHAQVLVDLGSALRRAGRRREARQPLAEGIDIASSCGAMPLVQRARTELLAAGARPRRVELSGSASLTPSEHRTATLAADGLSNREIAQQLFVSIRTVESQLRSAYQKLGIASRDQLAEAIDDRADSLVTA